MKKQKLTEEMLVKTLPHPMCMPKMTQEELDRFIKEWPKALEETKQLTEKTKKYFGITTQPKAAQYREYMKHEKTLKESGMYSAPIKKTEKKVETIADKREQLKEKVLENRVSKLEEQIKNFTFVIENLTTRLNGIIRDKK